MDKPAFEQFPAFEEFTDYVCKRIKSSRKKAEVKEELWSHLTDVYEQNLAIGMDTLHAQQDAVARMGDQEKLCREFAQLYSHSASDFMRSALNTLMLGLFFVGTRIMLFPYADKILPFCGQMLILYAIFRLYSINRQTKIAARLYPFYLLAGNIALFIRLYGTPYNWLVSAFALLAELIFTAFYIALFLGLNAACERCSAVDKKDPHLWLCIVSMLAYTYVSCLLALNTSVIADTTEYTYTNFFSLLPIIITLLGLQRTKSILSRSDSEYNLDKSFGRHGRKLFAAALAACLLVPFMSMCFAATRTPETAVYQTTDTQESAEAAAAIRQQMLDLGLPASVLQDLPDSEVLCYRTARHMESRTPYMPTASPVSYQAYVFYLEDFVPLDATEQDTEHKNYAVRVLYCFSGFDGQAMHLRDGFYLQFDSDEFVYAMEAESQDFCLLLGERDGTVYRAQPFLTARDVEENRYTLLTGFDFAFPKHTQNRRAYFASSGFVSKYGRSFLTGITANYYHQKFPLYIQYSNTARRAYAEMMLHAHASYPAYAPIDRLQCNETIDYQPAFVGIDGEWIFTEPTEE